MTRVRIPAPIPMYTLPKTLDTKAVARAEAEIFTILLPISTVLINFLESSVIFATRAAFLTFSSTIERILILFTEIIAVSADEKNPESRTRIKSTIMCIASLGSKSSSP